MYFDLYKVPNFSIVLSKFGKLTQKTKQKPEALPRFGLFLWKKTMSATKSKYRLRFRVAAFFFLLAALVMAFILSLVGKDVAAFGVVVGGLSLPIAGLLVTDYATKPGE